MQRRSFLRSLALAAVCPTCAAVARAETAASPGAASQAGGPHWGYQGAESPEHWGKLAKPFAICGTGGRQSPLDIVDPVRAELAPLTVEYRAGAAALVNNGHTIQLDVDPGSSLAAGRERFALVQYHFHHPSEHRIAGRSFPMECHFVHKSAQGTAGVLGVLLADGAANPAFAAILDRMPARPGAVKDGLAGIDPNALLPERRSYYRYAGSLTTPPCTEDVDWMLLSAAATVSAEQVARFAKLYPLNARPAQPAQKRFVLMSG